MKFDSSKILKGIFGGDDPGTSSTVLVAFSGPVRYGRMGIRDCFAGISKIKAGERTLTAIEQHFREALKAFQEEYIFRHPAFASGSMDIAYLVGIQSRGELQLFATDDAAMEPVPYQCVGSGAYLATFLLSRSPWDFAKLGLEEMAFWTINMLMRVKPYDPYCGGWSELQFLKNDGSFSRVSHFEISERERYLEHLDRATQALFMDCTRRSTSEVDFQNSLRRFEEAMARVRENWRDRQSEYEALFSALRKTFGPNEPELE